MGTIDTGSPHPRFYRPQATFIKTNIIIGGQGWSSPLVLFYVSSAIPDRWLVAVIIGGRWLVRGRPLWKSLPFEVTWTWWTSSSKMCLFKCPWFISAGLVFHRQQTDLYRRLRFSFAWRHMLYHGKCKCKFSLFLKITSSITPKTGKNIVSPSSSFILEIHVYKRSTFVE